MKKILIADENAATNMLLRFCLEKGGYEVDEVHRGPDALELLSRKAYDLLLLDYSIPGMDGERVCEEVRRSPSLKDLPIIVLTREGSGDKEALKSKGATDIVSKPVDSHELLGRIERYSRRT